MTKSYIQIDGQSYDADAIVHPNNREFRDAWQLSGTVIDVNMAMARSIHRDHIRRARTAAFDQVDKIATPLSRKAAGGNALSPKEMADLNGAEAAAQKLRDAPNDPQIDTAATPDELQALTLETLTA